VTFTTVATTNPLQRPLTEISRLHAALTHSTGKRSFFRKRDLFDEFVSNNKITTDGPHVNIASVSRASDLAVEKKWVKSDAHTFNLLDVHKNFPIFDSSIDCPASNSSGGLGLSAKAHIDADVDVSVTLTVGYIISGKIFPPSITRAAFTTALEGGAQAVFNVRADAIGTFDTGLLTLFEVSLPGLNIPGIITVSPTFAINGQAQASLDVTTQAKITAAYKLPKLQFVFPKDQGDSNADANDAAPAQREFHLLSHPGHSLKFFIALNLSVGGAASLTGKVEAHIIPRVEFPVSVLLGVAKASIYLQVDGYGVLDMSLAGSIAASASTPIGANTTTVDASISTSTAGASVSTSTSTSTYGATTTTAEAPTSTSTRTSTRTSMSDDAAITTAPVIAVDSAKAHLGNNLYKPMPVTGAGSKRDGLSYTYQGCVDLGAGVSINAGAQGHLFNLWSGDVNWDIYSKKWDIFKVSCLLPYLANAI
jgi:hypothetical protein